MRLQYAPLELALYQHLPKNLTENGWQKIDSDFDYVLSKEPVTKEILVKALHHPNPQLFEKLAGHGSAAHLFTREEFDQVLRGTPHRNLLLLFRETLLKVD